MDSLASVAVHGSQFPDRLRRELVDGLRSRRLNPKFHYESIKQAQKWLALHQAFSPAVTDLGGVEIYESLFETATGRVSSREVHVIGLGCGGGHKDVRLMQHLCAAGKQVSYSPVDVSVPMVLAARNAGLKFVAPEKCWPIVCDLTAVQNLPELLGASVSQRTARLVTFFGLLPNVEPGQVLPQLTSLISTRDSLLISANLAPGADYAAGVRRILPQYDNALTRDWLLTLLYDLGLSRADGRLEFGIQREPAAGGGLLRVEAHFVFARDTEVRLENESIPFSTGEKLRVFFSYRYTRALIEQLLRRHGLEIAYAWTTASEEEGVALVHVPG